MYILSRVCVDFYDGKNNLLHRITARDLGEFKYAPDTIQEDPLFRLLVKDGSIKFPADADKDKALEQDPFAGATAEGKEIKPKAASKPKSSSKAKAEGKAETKAEVKEEAVTESTPADEAAGIKI